MKKILLFALACVLLSGCSGSLGDSEYYLFGTVILKDKYFRVYEYNSRGEVVCDHYVHLDEEGRSETIVADKSTTSVEVPKDYTYIKSYKAFVGTQGKIALKKGDKTMIGLDVDY